MLVAIEALEAQLLEELAEIERRTALATEERKVAAEMLVAKSRQVVGADTALLFWRSRRLLVGASHGRRGQEGERYWARACCWLTMCAGGTARGA